MTYKNKQDLYDYQVKRWKQRKTDAIKYKGGKCQRCGFDRHYSALVFHHTNSVEKEANWNKIRLWSWGRVLKELDKCELLCANCHAIEHWDK